MSHNVLEATLLDQRTDPEAVVGALLDTFDEELSDYTDNNIGELHEYTLRRVESLLAQAAGRVLAELSLAADVQAVQQLCAERRQRRKAVGA